MRPSYLLDRLDYELPPELIAQHPLPSRSSSRMLVVNVSERKFTDGRFADLTSLIPAGSLMVFNNSRVIPARVIGWRNTTERGQGGGRVEVLFNKWLDENTCEAVIGSNSTLAADEVIGLPGGWSVALQERKSLSAIRVSFRSEDGVPATRQSLLSYLEVHGLPPLPPYIKREEAELALPGAADAARYQTVYARENGSVAAPTAGLHFDSDTLAEIDQCGIERCEVTLHVGYGTFAPVRVDDLAAHRMHAEEYSVDAAACTRYFAALAAGTPVIAVGTTSLRILHTLAELAPAQRDQAAADGLQGETDAFIYPGHGTQACNMLLTNFHLPRSTLLALVYALGGEELMRRAYQHAIEQRYRFYSYGDCMLIDCRGKR